MWNFWLTCLLLRDILCLVLILSDANYFVYRHLIFKYCLITVPLQKISVSKDGMLLSQTYLEIKMWVQVPDSGDVKYGRGGNFFIRFVRLIILLCFQYYVHIWLLLCLISCFSNVYVRSEYYVHLRTCDLVHKIWVLFIQ